MRNHTRVKEVGGAMLGSVPNGNERLVVGVRPVHAPSKLVLRITSECNLHCRFCHIWMNIDNKDRLLSSAEMEEAIKQFRQINPDGTVVFAGGELLLRKGAFFKLSSLCRLLNLRSYAVTNGSLVSESEYCQLLEEGPQILVFSLDSHDPKIHDWVRGTKGSYDAIRRTVEGLVEIRRNHAKYDEARIYFNSILFEENIALAEDFIEFAKAMGADGVKFQCLQPTLSNKSEAGSDPFYKKHFFQDKERAIKFIDRLIEKYKFPLNDHFLLNTHDDLEWMKKYIRLERPKSDVPVCDSFNDIIYMDQYGDYALCPSMDEIEDVGFIGNFRDQGLYAFWYGSEAMRAKEIMSSCTMSCGMMDCYRKGTTSI
jgi:MoaA/NifB/PqqE/SkfB family radical SAM enzyme